MEMVGEGVIGRVDGCVVVIGKFGYVCVGVMVVFWCEVFLKWVGNVGGVVVFVGIDGVMVGVI